MHRETFPLSKRLCERSFLSPCLVQFQNAHVMCPICEKVTEYPVRGVQTCEVCKANAEIERQAFYRDMKYPINYTSPLWYMKKV